MYRFGFTTNFSYTQDPTTNRVATNTTYLNSFNNKSARRSKKISTWLSSRYPATILITTKAARTLKVRPLDPVWFSNTFRVRFKSRLPMVPYLSLRHRNQSVENQRFEWGVRGVSSNVNSINLGPFIRGAITRLTDLDFGVGATLLDAKPSVHHLLLGWRRFGTGSTEFSGDSLGSHDLIFHYRLRHNEEIRICGRSSTQLNTFHHVYRETLNLLW